jgi:2'-5' RNA ligase
METGLTSSRFAMQKTHGQELHEYSLVAHPDNDVFNKVMEEKESFYDKYKEKVAISTQPHITVACFLAKESMEDTLIRWIQRICSQQQSFMVTLNNYSGFPPHTIYLRVQNELPFQQLIKNLNVVNTYINSCACPPMKLILKPHVSIAGNLPEDVYFKALIQYAHKSFHETFSITQLHLLKREHPYDAGKSINVFGLPPGENTLFN